MTANNDMKEVKDQKDHLKEEAVVSEADDEKELKWVILSPKAKSTDTGINSKQNARIVHLPPSLPLDEPLQSIRLALGELVGYAHFTCFRLELDFETDLSSLDDVQNDLIASAIAGNASPYTTAPKGDEWQVIPRTYMRNNDNSSSSLVLDEYGDLRQVLERFKGGKSSDGDDGIVQMRIKLDEYNLNRIRDHIIRLRQLFSGEAQYLPVSQDLVLLSSDEENDHNKPDTEKDISSESSAKSPSEALPSLNGMKGLFQDYEAPNLSSFLLSCSGDGLSNQKSVNKELKSISTMLKSVEEKCCVPVSIQFSGFHPPPSNRRLLGDLAYIEVFSNVKATDERIFVTATAAGFYVNESTSTVFDPSPAEKPCFSHTLLDCLLLRSKVVKDAWCAALKAAKQRLELSTKLSNLHSPFEAICHSSLGGRAAIDSSTFHPSWLVPKGEYDEKNDDHKYNAERLENNLGNMFGIDLRGGPMRDWNEELQSAREMSKATQKDRINRARLMHKVLSDFGDACVSGAVAIIDGEIMPMNPNENLRSHVYLHNNIFFSRAVDNGMHDTYRVAIGDEASRKTASRDAATIGVIHELDKDGIYTLGTVVVDYLGSRLVCQSVIPGLLHGESCHEVVYGAIETGTMLKSEPEVHKMVEDLVGKNFCVATRSIPSIPLTDNRINAAKATIKSTPNLNGIDSLNKTNQEMEDGIDEKQTVSICGPLELKGILGADKRKYLLDLTRLTPRDANWVPQSEGGTGILEKTSIRKKSSSKDYIPKSLDDPEWTMATLRTELIRSFINSKFKSWAESKHEGRKLEKERITKESENERTMSEALKEFTKKLEEEEEAFIQGMHVNVNVFLPDTKSLQSIDDKAYLQHQEDEDRCRDIARHLINVILPKLTTEVRESQANYLPIDGAALTEFIHRSGINCRYLGRLAELAVLEEEKDKEKEDSGISPLRKMPLCWLEMLECEMIARSSKHVLDSLLTDKLGRVNNQPASIIAAFLSCLVSTGEESAAETEKRLSREKFDVSASKLSFTNPISSRENILDRYEVWEAIRIETGRRFRYNLTLYEKDFSRSLFIPLLRRVCQKCGIRLFANDYAIGGKCHTELLNSYPISSRDIVAVLPLVKHSASGSAGFVPYVEGSACSSLSLKVLLPDAKAAYESAKVHAAARQFQISLQLSQEAAELYTKVVESPIHSSILKCMDFTALVLFQAQEYKLAAVQASRCLALWAQLKGFDSHATISALSTLAQILHTVDSSGCVKQILSAVSLMKIMAGCRHVDISQKLQLVGNLYLEAQDFETALKFFQLTRDKLPCNDVTIDAILDRNIGIALSNLSRYKEAIKSEQRSQMIFAAIFGKEHDVVKQSNERIVKYTTLAVKQGTENAANKMASQILESEAHEEEQLKVKGKKNGKTHRKNRSRNRR